MVRRLAVTAGVVLGLAALVVPLTGAAADHKDKRGRAQTIVVLPANPSSVSEPTAKCPALILEFALTNTSGKRVGTGTSCVQAFVPVSDTAQRVEAIFTLEFRDGKIVVDLTIDERFFEEDAPGITFQDFTGTVIRGTGAYRHAEGNLIGGGTVTFNADGSVSFDSVIVVTLRR